MIASVDESVGRVMAVLDELKLADNSISGKIVVESDEAKTGAMAIGALAAYWADGAPLDANAVRLHVSDNHVTDWLHAIRGRTSAATSAEIGHRSTSVCTLGHLCMKTGKSLKWDWKTERFVGNDLANSMLVRPMHNGWKLS